MSSPDLNEEIVELKALFIDVLLSRRVGSFSTGRRQAKERLRSGARLRDVYEWIVAAEQRRLDQTSLITRAWYRLLAFLSRRP